MIPGGVILTRMIWNKPKYWPFNIGLLAWQLTFLIVGTAYGKIKTIDGLLPSTVIWAYRWIVVPWSIVLVTSSVYYGITSHWIYSIYFFILLAGVWLIPFALNGMLKPIWWAATICHVRLCLGDSKTVPVGVWYNYITFTAPEAKIEIWSQDWVSSRFSYHDPTFDVSDAEIKAMNHYAERIKGDPVARKYDYLQLLSFAVNLPLWIVYPPCWGREVIGWFNLPGGREVCSSGVAAILLENILALLLMMEYNTAMISPCLFNIDENWKH